jgi:hypothetical protein
MIKHIVPVCICWSTTSIEMPLLNLMAPSAAELCVLGQWKSVPIGNKTSYCTEGFTGVRSVLAGAGTAVTVTTILKTNKTDRVIPTNIVKVFKFLTNSYSFNNILM